MYTTRTQMEAALVKAGMSAAFAKVATDQQYNYQDDRYPTDSLFNGPGELVASQTDADVAMVKATWEGLLSIDGDTICVDGEPMYDLQGERV